MLFWNRTTIGYGYGHSQTYDVIYFFLNETVQYHLLENTTNAYKTNRIYFVWEHFNLNQLTNYMTGSLWSKFTLLFIDQNEDTQDFLAIVCEDLGKVKLFDPIDRSVHPTPAYTIEDSSKPSHFKFTVSLVFGFTVESICVEWLQQSFE